MGWFDSLLWPIMWVVAWVMVALHKIFDTIGLGPSVAWTLSIVGLTIATRIVLIPLFFRQIKASRGLQLIQPEIREIQQKYKGKTDQESRQAMAAEQMELYKKHKTNPFSSCLPILAQSPVFFALFRVLNSLAALAEGTYKRSDSIGPLNQELAKQAESATLFGAPLSSTFMGAHGPAATTTRIVTVLLIVAMSGSMFFMQRQLTMKNMPAAALEGPIAQQQKMMMYMMPVIFAVTGVNFAIGVLIYWTVSNLWTLGQQFYAIRRMPAPGSQAEAALEARRARKAQAHPAVVEDAPAIDEAARTNRQRQQPLGKSRAKKQAQRKTPGASGASSADGSSGGPDGREPDVQDLADVDGVADLDSSGTLDEKPSGRTGSDGPRKPKKKTSARPDRASTSAGDAVTADAPGLVEQPGTDQPIGQATPRKPRKKAASVSSADASVSVAVDEGVADEHDAVSDATPADHPAASGAAGANKTRAAGSTSNRPRTPNRPSRPNKSRKPKPKH